MAFTTGRFGVQYHPRDGEETHLLRWVVVVAVSAVLVAFACFQISRWRKSRNPEPAPKAPVRHVAEAARRPAEAEKPAAQPVRAAAPARPLPVQTNAAPRAAVPATESARAPAAQPKRPEAPKKPETKIAPGARALVAKAIETMADRPANDRVLLERLVAAEQQGNATIAADTIRKLCTRPTMADLKDALLRRLGDLNMSLLLSGQATPWTTTATVRRGDGRERIAREHRTTPAAVARLNPSVKWEKLQPGDTVRVLDFPSAALVVHTSGYADLSLNKNGQFFRRYYLSVGKSAKSGVYPVESGASAANRFRELGLRLAPADRAELEMFLPAGSRIVVSAEQ